MRFRGLGEPDVAWNWMSESGAGSGGDPGTSSTSDGESGDPGSAGEGGVDTPASGGEGAGGEGGAAGSSPTSPAASAKTEADWRDKRIATLTRRLREAQEKGQQPAPDWTPPGQLSQADVDRLAEQKARELSVIHDFNRRCDEVALAGRRTFGDQAFNGQIANLQKVIDQDDPVSVQSYNSFLMAAIETGDAPKLLHALGSNLDEAQRIMALPPTRMAVELTKLAMGPEQQVSGAPRPLTPVGGRGAAHELIQPDDADRADHLGTSEWMRRREKQIEERMKARAQR